MDFRSLRRGGIGRRPANSLRTQAWPRLRPPSLGGACRASSTSNPFASSRRRRPRSLRMRLRKQPPPSATRRDRFPAGGALHPGRQRLGQRGVEQGGGEAGLALVGQALASSGSRSSVPSPPRTKAVLHRLHLAVLRSLTFVEHRRLALVGGDLAQAGESRRGVEPAAAARRRRRVCVAAEHHGDGAGGALLRESFLDLAAAAQREQRRRRHAPGFARRLVAAGQRQRAQVAQAGEAFALDPQQLAAPGCLCRCPCRRRPGPGRAAARWRHAPPPRRRCGRGGAARRWISGRGCAQVRRRSACCGNPDAGRGRRSPARSPAGPSGARRFPPARGRSARCRGRRCAGRGRPRRRA
jgi:hypothetical protein